MVTTIIVVNFTASVESKQKYHFTVLKIEGLIYIYMSKRHRRKFSSFHTICHTINVIQYQISSIQLLDFIISYIDHVYQKFSSWVFLQCGISSMSIINKD